MAQRNSDAAAAPRQPLTAPKPQADDAQTARSKGAEAYQQHKQQQKLVKKAEREVAQSEAEITRLEQLIAQMEEQFADPAKASDMQFIEKYTEAKRLLDEENNRWMQLSERLEELLSQQ